MRWRVKYFDKGQIAEAIFTGSEDGVRTRLVKENKTVLQMQRLISLGGTKKRAEEVIAVLKALADLIGVGVSLPEAIETVAISLDKTSELKAVLTDIHRRMDEGTAFTTVIETHRDVWGNTVTQMIKSGFETGNLSQTFAAASKFISDMETARQTMWKKLTVPLITLTVGTLLLVGDTQFVIPLLLESELFKSVVKTEDVSIQALRIISVFVPAFFALLVLGVIAVFWQSRRDPELIERNIARVPMLRDLLFHRYFFIGFFSLANLIESGVRLATALEIVRDAIDSKLVKREFNEALKRLRNGDSFADGFVYVTRIERTMLKISVSDDKIKQNMRAIAERFYTNYMARIAGIAPKIYILVTVFVLAVFGLMIMGIMVPYSKVLSGL